LRLIDREKEEYDDVIEDNNEDEYEDEDQIKMNMKYE
jgi:hypothetical protein